jgi:hypothetical protein
MAVCLNAYIASSRVAERGTRCLTVAVRNRPIAVVFKHSRGSIALRDANSSGSTVDTAGGANCARARHTTARRAEGPSAEYVGTAAIECERDSARNQRASVIHAPAGCSRAER